MPRPMPVPPPVTSATCPLSLTRESSSDGSAAGLHDERRALGPAPGRPPVPRHSPGTGRRAPRAGAPAPDRSPVRSRSAVNVGFGNPPPSGLSWSVSPAEAQLDDRAVLRREAPASSRTGPGGAGPPRPRRSTLPWTAASASGVSGRGARADGVASSTRSFAQARGWTKATLPARPWRGFPSIMSTPVPRNRRTSRTTSSDSKQTWWSALPAAREEAGDPGVGRHAAPAPPPRPSRRPGAPPGRPGRPDRPSGGAAARACRARSARPASRSWTTTPTWWMRVITRSPEHGRFARCPPPYPTPRGLQRSARAAGEAGSPAPRPGPTPGGGGRAQAPRRAADSDPARGPR